MTTIAEIRAKYPQYEDLPDEKLVRGLHAKHYSDMDYDAFAAKIDMTQPVAGSSQQDPVQPEQATAANAVENVNANQVDPISENVSRETPIVEETQKASKLTSAVGGAVQGATFGFGDEIEAVLASALPIDKMVDMSGDTVIKFGDYKGNLAKIRARNDIQKKSNPKTYFAGELGGGVATGGVGVAKVGAVAASGAAGAAYGAGSAEGGLDDRAKGAVIGGALGLAGGAAANKVTPILAKGIAANKVTQILAKGISGAAARLTGNTKLAKADRIILKEVMRQNKVGRDEAINLIKNANGDTPELMFQTLGLQEFAEGAATSGGTSRAAFEQAIIKQQRGQQDRINTAVKNIVGGEDFNALKGEIGEKLLGEGSKLYGEAFEQNFRVTQNLAKLSQRPAMKKALAQGARIAADEGIEVADNPLLTYHYAKMGLDKMIGTSVRKSGGNPQARAFMKIKEELLSEMDTVPQYAQARKLWAGQKANEAALELGRSVLSKRADDVAVQVSGLSKGEKQHLLAGVIQAVDDKLQGKSLAHDATTPFKSEKVRNVLRELLTEDQATKMLNMIDAESRLTQTGRRVRPSFGSPTAPKQEALKRVQAESAGPVRRGAGAAINIAQAPVQSVRNAINAIANKVTSENPSVIEALAVRLSGTPEEAAQVFGSLSSTSQSRVSAIWQDAGGLTSYTAGFGAATAAPKTKALSSE